MFWTNTKRILHSGFVSFFRNGFVSLGAVLMMTITLFAIGSLLFSGHLLEQSLDELESKVDINVYFVTDAPEEEILAMKRTIEALPQTKEAIYTSRDHSLAEFRERHKDDNLTLQALDELGSNPLGASLNIRAQEPSQYQDIANFLESDSAISTSGASIIDKVNYNQNKDTIESLTRIIDESKRANLMKTGLMVFVALLITFNTIRLAIYNSRDEIKVMRLVGGGNWYVQGPFIISGIMYGVISAIVVLGIFYPVTIWFGPLFYPFNFFSSIEGTEILTYYSNNFDTIFLAVFGTGVVLGALSSFLAVKRYLKV